MIRRLAALLEENDFPPYLTKVLSRLHSHYVYLSGEIEEVDKELKTHLAEDETAQRLLTLPGVGPVTASLLATRLGDGKTVPAAVTLRLQPGWFPGSTAPVEKRHA